MLEVKVMQDRWASCSAILDFTRGWPVSHRVTRAVIAECVGNDSLMAALGAGCAPHSEAAEVYVRTSQRTRSL